MEEAVLNTKKAAASDILIASRLETTLRVTREDEARLMRIIKMRRLKRRAKRMSRT